MKDDLILRGMAIAYACSGLLRRMDDGDWRRVADIREDLENMPSAQPEWIPCSERLPEKDGKYLVTHRKFGKLEATWNIFYGDNHASWLWNDEIVAWMPLPEPWRGEEDDIE